MRGIFNLDAKVQTLVDNSAELFKGIAALMANEVLVGVPEEKTDRNDGAISNAALAYIHNFGSPTQNIPPRPFLEPGITDAKDRITEQFRKAADVALDGDAKGVLKNMNAAGLVASTAVKMKIQRGPFIPLKPGTLAARRRRGHIGTRPLIETGQLRNAITYVVRRAK